MKLRQLFCRHSHTLTRHKGAHLYTECTVCGKETRGVTTGGFKYVPEVYERIEASKQAVQPKCDRKTKAAVAI